MVGNTGVKYGLNIFICSSPSYYDLTLPLAGVRVRLRCHNTASMRKLYSHVTRLELAVSARRACEVELAAERQLAARAADVGSLGVLGDDPVMRVSKVFQYLVFLNKTYQS